jgi:hypothetical protein
MVAIAVLTTALAVSGDAPVTLQGIGLLHVGLPVATLRSRFGATEEEGDPDSDCSYWTSSSYRTLR